MFCNRFVGWTLMGVGEGRGCESLLLEKDSFHIHYLLIHCVYIRHHHNCYPPILHLPIPIPILHLSSPGLAWGGAGELCNQSNVCLKCLCACNELHSNLHSQVHHWNEDTMGVSVEMLRGIEGIGKICVRKLGVEGRVEGEGRGCESLLLEKDSSHIHYLLIPILISVERLGGIEGIGRICERKLRVEGRVQGEGRGCESLMSTMRSHYQNLLLIYQVCAFWLCGS